MYTIVGVQIFQSTRPIRGATFALMMSYPDDWISIHAPHTGRDLLDLVDKPSGQKISIHAPHTGRDMRETLARHGLTAISIHAPHTGRDVYTNDVFSEASQISIHAPHTGRDLARNSAARLGPFQSTRPIRGATHKQNIL